MKKKIKTIISLVLAMVIVGSSFFATQLTGMLSSAAEGSTITEPVFGTGWELRTTGELVLTARVAAGTTQSAPWYDYADAITTVSICCDLNSIDDYLFENTNIASIYIPTSVESVSSKAFDGCKNLAVIYYGGDNTQWSKLDVSVDNVTTLFNHVHTEGTLENVKSADCTNNGYTGDTYCSVCGNIVSLGEVTPLSHVWSEEKVPESPATCLNNNGIKAYQCTVCKIFDKTSEEEYSEEVPHTYGEVTEKSTSSCDDGATYKAKCSVCGTVSDLTSTEHSYEKKTVAATCTETGEEKMVCKYCGDEYTVNTIDALGHDYSDIITVNPDCTHSGLKYCKCTRCDSVEWEKVLPATGHTETEWKVTTTPTCSKEGTETLYCAVCGEVILDEDGNEQTRTVDKTDVHTNLTTNEIKPTCTDDGLKVTVCSECGKEISREIVPATGHNYVNKNEVYCSEGGTIVIECTNCGNSYEKVVEKSDSHDLVTEKVAATCTKDGYVKVMCKNCTYSKTTPIDATGHNYVQFTFKKATCTEDGLYAKKCTYCGEIVLPDENASDYEEKYVIKAAGHNWETVVVTEATCAQAGFKYDRCTVCGEITNRVYTEQLPHQFEVKIIKEAGCVNTGTQQSVCSVCGYADEEVIIPATGHNWGEIIEVPPTCEKAGQTKHICKTCGEPEIVNENYKAPLDHVLVWVEAQDATCDEPGFNGHYECKNCNYTEGFVTYPKLEHDSGEPVTENNVEPTCTTSGKYDTVVYCTRCNAEITRKTSIVAPLGHSESDPIIENNVNPKCTTSGKYDTVVYCSVCGDELNRKTTIVAPVGHSASDPMIENLVSPTCTVNGKYDTVTYCSGCGIELSREETITEAIGHNWTIEYNWSSDNSECTAVAICQNCGKKIVEDGEMTIVEVEKTCISNGTKTFNAKFTSTDEEGNLLFEEKTKEITDVATGHVPENVAYKAPTCTTDGCTAGVICSVCGEVLTAQTIIPALGHTISATVIENNVESTCSKAGSYDQVVYCSVCHDEISRTNINVPVKDHAFGSYKITKEATAFKDGTKTRYCSVCGYADSISYSLTFPEKILWCINWFFSILNIVLTAVAGA